MPGTSKVTLAMGEIVVNSSSQSPTSQGRTSPCRTSPGRGGRPRSKTPEVSVRTDPSGDIHVTVKVSELNKPHKKKCKRGPSSPVTSPCSSYLAPPENITPSQRLLLDALCIQVNRRALNEELKGYIDQLLRMSRGSIEQLTEQDYIDPTLNSPEKDINNDIIKLSELTGEYAEQVNTLVDILDRIEAPRSPSPQQRPPPVQHVTRAATPCQSRLPRPVPAPVTEPPRQQSSRRGPCAPGRPRSGGPSPTGSTPRRGPSPTGSTPRRGPSPTGSTPRRGPSPTGSTPRRGPSPTGSTPRGGPSPSGRPTSGGPSSSSAMRTPSPAQRIPLKPSTPPMGRRPRPLTPVSTKVVGPPPGSDTSKIPISPKYQLQQQATPGIQIPFRISANLLPHPDDLPPMVPRGMRPITAGYQPAVSPVLESPERQFPCPPHSTAGFAGTPQQAPRRCPEEQFTDHFVGEQFTDHFVGQQFNGDLGAQDFTTDFGAHFPDDCAGQQFNDDFGGDWNNVDQLLEASAASSGHLTYPGDFPSRTDVFGPGFDWDAANLTDPAWPKSFPGHPSMAQSAVSDSDHINIDSSFDSNAIQYPVNVEKINKIRAKLSRICNDQYREVIQVLQRDQARDQNEMENLLKRVRSDPFQDPDATLAPIGYAVPDSRSGSPSSPSKNKTINNIEAMNILSDSIKHKTVSPRGDDSTPITNFEEVD